MLPLIASTQPAGSSVKELLHLFQLIDSGMYTYLLRTIGCYSRRLCLGKFRQFDFGLVKNLLNYGHMSPPQYDISQVTAPVALYYGENDRLSSVEVSKCLRPVFVLLPVYLKITDPTTFTESYPRSKSKAFFHFFCFFSRKR